MREQNHNQASEMENNISEIRDEQSSEILQVCEECRSRHKRLEQIIYEMISTSVKELCFEYRFEKQKIPSSDDISRPKLFVSIQRPDEADIDDLALALTDQRKQLGRKIKNPVTGEKVVCFDIPEDFDVEGIKNIEEIKDRLGKWRIQRRQRDSKMNDTYYCHLASRRTFRSMLEALNFIMYGPQNKRKASDIASTSQGDNMMIAKPPSKKRRKDKGKQMITASLEPSSSSSSENTTLSNLELSIVPWSPLESEMNMYYCHLSSRQIQRTSQALSILLHETQPNKAMENFVDLTEESDDENGISSNSEMTEVTQDKVDNSSISELPPLKSLVDINLLEMFDDYVDILGDTTFEDLLGEINDHGVNPRSNEKEIEKEKQALVRTEPVELLTITEFSNKQNKNLQENCIPAEKFATLEEAKQKLALVELEGVDDDDHFQHDVYFSEPDPVNHISTYDYDYNDVVGFLYRD